MYEICMAYEIAPFLVTEEQNRMFEESNDSKYLDKSCSKWVEHTLHCFYACLQLVNLSADSVKFVAVRDTINVDILKEPQVEYKTNDRNLDPF